MMRQPYQFFKTWLPTCAGSALVSFSYLLYLVQGAGIRLMDGLLTFILLWITFSLIIYAALFRFILPRLADYSIAWKRVILAGYLVFGLWLAHNIPVEFPSSEQSLSPSVGIKILFLGGVGLGIGLALLLLVLFLTGLNDSPAARPGKRRFRWALFALPMVIIWGIYLLAYWPGMMSADLMDQWGQVLTGQYNNHHPFFHTFTIWLLTRIVLSPTIVAIAQIIGLAAVAGCVLAYFEELGVPSAVLWLAGFLFALTPINGTMVNTLWKDIPYSTALLALTFLVFRIAQSRGDWLAERGSWAVLGITGVLVALFRHNGPPVVVGLSLLLLVVYFRWWKRLLPALLLGAGIYYIFTSPVEQWVRVSDSTILAESSTVYYSIAAQSTPGSVNAEIMDSMDPLAANIQCTLLPEIYQSEQAGQLATKSPTLGQKMINLVEYVPRIFLYSYRCNRSLVWIIWDPMGEVRNPAHVEVLVDPNPYGLQPDSQIPALRDIITRFVIKTAHDPDYNWLVWRPAIYLYFFLLVISTLSIKQKIPG